MAVKTHAVENIITKCRKVSPVRLLGNRKMATIPRTNSTIGYLKGILKPHLEHFPRNHRKLINGIFSYQATVLLHPGQKERGRKMFISLGSRYIKTLIKLPIMVPNKKINKYIFKIIDMG